MLLILVILLSGAATIVSSTWQVITSCPIDMYAVVDVNGNDILGCFPCATCPPGYGVEQQCSATRNTICALCQPGTFSNTTSKSEICSACSRCPEHQRLEDCTPLSDTVCKKDCERGFYYDRATDACLKCSYCFPAHPYAQTVRVEDCHLQGMDDLYQCSPLPLPNNHGESHRPPSVGQPGRNEGHLGNTRLGRQPSATDQRQGLRRHNNHNGRRGGGKIRNRTTGEPTLLHERVSTDSRERISSTTSSAQSVSRHIPAPAVTAKSPPIVGNGPRVGDNSANVHIFSPNQQEIILQNTSSVDVDSPIPRNDTPSHSSASDDVKISEQRQNQEGYKTLTRSDIGIVVLIALACGLVSFVTTAVTCHFLMRRGKNVGSSVSVARSEAPKKAWTYQDLMPSTADILPLIDTPPQTRKMTCV